MFATALSTYLLTGPPPEQLSTRWLDRAQAAGFRHVELFASRDVLNYRDRGQIKNLANWFRDSPLKPYALHTPPEPNIADADRARRREACDEISRALEVLELIPCQYVVQHFGGRGDLFHGRRIDAAYASLDELHRFARERGAAALLVENGTSELAQPERIARFLEETRLPLGVSFDTGHAHLAGKAGLEAAFETLRPYIRAAHVHDNNGRFDQHLAPLAAGGTIDWRLAMRLLRGHNEIKVLTASVRDTGEWPDPATAVHDSVARLLDLKTARNDEEEE
ncbi:MAG: sugar phosphate isomerase/epimerase [Bryobacterales bacterium]|nr:sugar phosphate isomerase/epimerase [Bryobacterales bacterium]